MPGSGTPAPVAIVVVVVLVVLLLAAVAYVLRTRRGSGSLPAAGSDAAVRESAGPREQTAPATRSAPSVPPADLAGNPWPGGLPPHIRAAQAAGAGAGVPQSGPVPGPAPAGVAGAVSFGVGLTGIHREEGALQVLWHGINDGGEPVAVQWGRPEVRVDGERIAVRYVYEAAAGPFEPPRTRPLGPDEIVSRTALVPLSGIGRDPAGMTVQVFVAFGAAAGLAAAQSDQAAYLAWQQVTYTRPRSIPAS